MSRKPSPEWPDHQLVQSCLQGNQDAWAALIRKYKNLIYSVPARYGFCQDDAADVFQTVCVELYNGLPNLRNVDALRGWLLRVAAHECFHRKQSRERRKVDRLEDNPDSESQQALKSEPIWLEDLEKHQIIREAMLRLTPRCHKMIQMLFFDEPARSYDDVAASLGLATGSIGFIRARCLKRMAQALQELGW